MGRAVFIGHYARYKCPTPHGPNPLPHPTLLVVSFTSTPNKMSKIHVTPQEMSNLYTTVYCVYAACAILIYDWLLCLDQEVRFIWNWRPGVSVVSLLLYALSRYALLISRILSIATNYPMSDLVRNPVW
ncbi:hypothetical protein LXA43DRAFT_48525 [Ganoderma leucocontextum]|nr:hypothetical protein LXA43DRAFT_48525 [Ganoderma leucocontextum]